MDDAIRELHGVVSRDRITEASRRAIVSENGDRIHIQADDQLLTEWQARYLAAKLYRLARRIKNRRENSNGH